MWDGRAQLEKKMIKRVSASQMVAQQAASSAPRNSFPRLQDILVNLSVKDEKDEQAQRNEILSGLFPLL